LRLGCQVISARYTFKFCHFNEHTVLPIDNFDGITTAGEITVTFDSENQEGLNIQIIDLLGKVIFETKKSVEKGETVIPLDLPKMSSGIYNIIVESKSQKFTERFSYSVN
jgi:Secretion system C-terminal sorting domain